MRLQSVKDLKAELMETVVAPAVALSTRATVSARAVAASALAPALSIDDATLGIATASFDEIPKVIRSVALGVSKRGPEHQLAIRVQRQALLNSPLVQHLVKKARGEANVRSIGRLEKRATARRAKKAMSVSKSATTLWHRGRVRPLQIGTSLGHVAVTAGTLGAFVRNKREERLILSNNHVLANENDAAHGDEILQPGRLDGGRSPADIVGALEDWIELKAKGVNLVDAAVASIADGIDSDPTLLQGIAAGVDKHLAGLGPDFLDEGTLVYKVGRTTGATVGRVTAFDMDNVVVGYDLGNLRFDGQIEIEGAEDGPFSAGGDSGSIIVDGDYMAVALLFAGGDIGGTNGLGLTYANPIHTVLTDLDVELVY